jgi:uncharacterized repeat protein (TIGR01451 family)
MGNKMKNIIKLSLGVLCMLALLLPQIAFAAGTPAGTVISNFATMNYKDLAGNSFPAFNSNTVTVVVARLAGVDIAPPTAAKTAGDSIYVYYPFTLTNTGNSTDTLLLSSVSNQGWTQALYHDANNNGILDPAELAAGAVTQTDSVQEDAQWHGIARIFVPFHTPSGTVDSLHVTVRSHLTTDTTRTAAYVTTISSGVLTVSKTVSPTNPKPGDQVTYTINYSNTGTGPALNTVITDVLNSNYTYVNGSITPTPTGDSSKYINGSRTVAWYVGKVPGLGSGTMTFKVTVNANVPYHTSINNQANIAWIDSTNGHPRADSGSSPAVTVNQVTLGNVLPDTTMSLTQDAGLKAVYPFTFHNLGNGTDSLSIAPVSSLGFSWTYYVDTDSNGVVSGSDYTFAGNTPSNPQGGNLYLLGVATIPHATADRAKDSTSFVFTFLSSGTFKDTVKTITTVRAPKMVLTKAVTVFSSPSGSLPVPGAVLEYTITYRDTGSGASANVVVTDSIPQYTTYQAHTVSLNGVLQGDGTGDGDGTTVVGTLMTVDLGTVNAGSTGTIKFHVKIN